MDKLKWYLWQLVPATYRSFYTEDGVRYFHVWQMWFGRCFNETRVKVETPEPLFWGEVHAAGEQEWVSISQAMGQ